MNENYFNIFFVEINSPLISKLELFVTIINGFYQILIVSYNSIIDVAGALYLF